jgi:tRNA 2-selenouridine synthase
MAITRLSVSEFLSLAKEHPVLDVRSPGEFMHAQIPGAYNLPLFSDEERKIVGTAYKQESKEAAIKLGLNFFGTKMVKMVEEVEELCKVRSTKHETQKKEETVPRTSYIVLVHCWRGGMRSAGVAWLLDLYGFTVYTLVGGYKAYRKWVLMQFEQSYPITILGGFTGSGKTEALQALAKRNLPVIDLEKLASHKGSAFGNLGQPPQPSQEMFENLLAKELAMIREKWQLTGEEENGALHGSRPTIWIEDESQRIGEVNIPTVFFKQMRQKQLYFLNIPFESRLDFIVANYGSFEKAKLINAIMRIQKRLGGLETKTAINALLENNIKACFEILLFYYDKFYLKSLQTRENLDQILHRIEQPVVSDTAAAENILAAITEGGTAN